MNINTINTHYNLPFDMSVCLKPRVILLLVAGALFILGHYKSRPQAVQTEPLFLP